MNIKQIIMTSLLSFITAMTFIACSDDDSNNDIKIPTVSPKEQWGATLKGDGEVLGAYPDLYSNYWEYTYEIDKNSDKILCLKGEYPHCRYFSISLYNDKTGDVLQASMTRTSRQITEARILSSQPLLERTISPSMWCQTERHKA